MGRALLQPDLKPRCRRLPIPAAELSPIHAVWQLSLHFPTSLPWGIVLIAGEEGATCDLSNN